MDSKISRYHDLIIQVGKCTKCMTGQETKGIKLVQDFYRSQINLWSHWQGSLEAEILVIGQDWGELPTGKIMEFWTQDPIYPSLTGKHPEIPKKKFITDNNLTHIVWEALGLDLKEKQDNLFFTNAVLCYRDKGFTGAVDTDWFRKCQPYCARLIEIIEPKAIVTLGYMPLRALSYGGILSIDESFSDPDKTLKLSKTMSEIVEDLDLLYYRPDESKQKYRIFPMYHCGSWGTKARSTDMQVKDWARLDKFIKDI